MASAAEYLLPLRPGLVPVPAASQAGICELCHGACESKYQRCYQCREALLSIGASSILPVSMSIETEMLHRHLRGYKDDRNSNVRARMSFRLAALLAVFTANHESCIGEYDSVVGVPSPDRTAIEPVVLRIAALRERYVPALETTGRWTKADLSDDRFIVTREVSRERVLLIDDTFTRGRSLFSAAATLRGAGATIVGPLVLGRHVRRNYGPSQEMLRWLENRSWDDERCCRCAGERADPGTML